MSASPGAHRPAQTVRRRRRLPAASVRSRPGGALVLHRHPVLEVYYFLEGSGLVTLDGTERSVQLGVTVSIPADVPHAIRNTGAGPLKLFYAFPVDSFSEVLYTTL
jgi:mannose-6-phosphate isomerase-like protein (cupin superfamily)